MGEIITDPEALARDLRKLSSFDLMKLLDGEGLRESSDELHKVDDSPVDINAFLDEGRFLGNYFDGQFLSDRNNYWRVFLNEIYRDVYDSPYWLCCMKGAIGVGKTTTACAGMAYDAYRLLCLGDPQRTLGVIPTDKIEFAIFNVTLTLAINVVWDKISQMFTSSEYFNNLLGASRRKHREDSLLPKRIDFYSGSRVGHSLGHSVYCLTGDTVIPVLSGEKITLKEIVETYKDRKIYVYSYDLNRKGLVPGRVIAGKLMGIQPVYRISLSNGKHLDATLNHQLYFRNGKKIKVKDLKVGDRLLPMKFYHKYAYTGFADPYTGVVSSVYRKIAEWKYGLIKKGQEVHHKDFCQRNDDPSNLCLLPKNIHHSFHSNLMKNRWNSLKGGKEKYEKFLEKLSKSHIIAWQNMSEKSKKIRAKRIAESHHQLKKNNEKYYKIAIENLDKAKGWIYSELNAEHIRGSAKKYWSGRGVSEKHSQIMKEVYQRFGNELRRLQCSNVMSQAINNYWIDSSYEEQRKIHIRNTQRTKAIKRSYRTYIETDKIPCPEYVLKYFSSQEEFEDSVRNYNHKIVKIEYIGDLPVYDITVEKYHNFAVAGILSSNSVVIDEANFEVLTGQVRKNFYSLIRRMETRYMSLGGGFPGKIWIISSETDKSSVLNQIIEEYRGKKGVIVRQPSLWEAKPERYDKDKKRFKVFRGTELRSPVIIDETNETEYKNEEENIILVPQEHRDSFEASIHDSLRDLAGISTGTSYKLFRMKEKVNNAMCVDLLFPEVFELDFHDDIDQISNKVLIPQYFKKIFCSEYPRYLHIDIGLTGDRLGVGCTYVSQYKERTKISITDLKKITEMVPEVVTEFAFAIQAKGGHPIPLFKVRAFILWLSGLGYTFGMISCDGYESADFLMMMHKLGFATEELSVDKTSLPYLKLRSYIYEELIFLPANRLLRKELDGLESTPDGSKVDHPEKFLDGTRGCLSGETHIALLDGTNPTIKELTDSYSGEPIYLYTVRKNRNKRNEIGIGIARNPRLTKKNAETIIVKIDTGEKIICTPDHKFMLRNGLFQEAQSLKIGDSLMPFYKKISKGNKRDNNKMIGYQMLKRIDGNGWSFTHRMVGKWLDSRYTGNQHGGLIVHHAKGKLNNDPRYLKLLSRMEHGNEHRNDILQKRSNLDFENKRIENLKKYNDSNREQQSLLLKSIHERPEFKSALKERSSKLGKITGPRHLIKYNKSEKHREIASKIGKNTIWFAIEASKRKDVTIEKILDTVKNSFSINEVVQKLKCSEGLYRNRIKENGLSLREVRDMIKPVNHKIISIESGPITDVYDITVEDTQNFALSSGIFVHNSKDIADSVAGSLTSTLRNSDKYKMVYFRETDRESMGSHMRTMFWPGGKETGNAL